MKKFIVLVVCSLFIQFPGVAKVAAQASESWAKINQSVADNQVIPRYAKFSQLAASMADLSTELCSDLDNESLLEFQTAYHLSMDAWQAIQHVQFGPVTYFNWNFRLQYWPDEKGSSGRQLNGLITAQDQNVFNGNNFARQSVGVQGLPALERLLFEEGALSELQNDAYRCELVQMISRNINEMAAGIQQRWVDEFRTVVITDGESDSYESAEDATIDFMKSLVETLSRITEQKISLVLGDSFARARIRKAESWRSARSLRNIKINLNTLAQLFSGSGEQGELLSSALLPEDVSAIKKGFAEIVAALEILPDSMADVLASEAQYQQLKAVQEQLEVLDDVLEDALKNTDLYLGFNSLDGD